MPTSRMLARSTPVVRVLEVAIRQLLVIKARLPFLLAIKEEGDRLVALGGRLRNDAALQMFRDTHDMLVIDLDSLREHAAKGIFTRLCEHLDILRRFRAKDMDAPEPVVAGQVAPEATQSWIEDDRQFFADSCNKHFDWLFPCGDPVTHEHVREMIGRFQADTLPTMKDRNDARAHRYGNRVRDANAAFQTLEKVQEQIEIFERYFRSVLLALTGGYSTMDLVAFHSDWKGCARDIADLIVLGGINEATVQYGLVGGEAYEERYWRRREEFFARGGTITE